MSRYTGVVTARDVLGWAITQGVFTEQGIREGEVHQPVVSGVDGPWMDVLDALMTVAAEGLGDPASGIERHGWLDHFEEYVEARCLAHLVDRFSLTADQSAAVLRLAEDIRLFFDGTIAIGSTGLDGPLKGDLLYQARFDYDIEIPEWAASRAT